MGKKQEAKSTTCTMIKNAWLTVFRWETFMLSDGMIRYGFNAPHLFLCLFTQSLNGLFRLAADQRTSWLPISGNAFSTLKYTTNRFLTS